MAVGCSPTESVTVTRRPCSAPLLAAGPATGPTGTPSCGTACSRVWQGAGARWWCTLAAGGTTSTRPAACPPRRASKCRWGGGGGPAGRLGAQYCIGEGRARSRGAERQRVMCSAASPPGLRCPRHSARPLYGPPTLPVLSSFDPAPVPAAGRAWQLTQPAPPRTPSALTKGALHAPLADPTPTPTPPTHTQTLTHTHHHPPTHPPPGRRSTLSSRTGWRWRWTGAACWCRLCAPRCCTPWG